MVTMVDNLPIGMQKGSRVTWTTASGVHGSGQIISDITMDPWNLAHVLVAVDAAAGEEHRVIYCAVTWLTAIPD